MMASLDDAAYAIGANKKQKPSMRDWFGTVVSVSPLKVAPLGSTTGVTCVPLARFVVGDSAYVITRANGQCVADRIGGCTAAVLYNNQSGTTGTVTLSDSAVNYDFMRIYFRKTNGQNQRGSVDIFTPNQQYANLTLFEPYAADLTLWFTSKTVYINGTSITNYDYCNGAVTSSGNTIGSQNEIAIYRVEAW